MANPPTATRLFRRVLTRQVPAQPDFADMGTAFGLDLSMGPPADEMAQAAAPAARDSNWWRRLAARRSLAR